MTKAASGDKISFKPQADAAAAAGMDSGMDSASNPAPIKSRRKAATKASGDKSSAKSKTKAAKPKYVRPRGGEARRVADLVPEVGGTAFRKFGFIQTSVVSRWAEIVGARLAKVTQPVLIRYPTGSKAGGTLHLSICGAHAPMLQHIGPDIVESVNRFFGYAAIASVRMAHGLTPPKPPKPKAELGPVPADLSDSLRQIADPELRTVLERMAAGLSVSRDLPRSG